VGASAEQQKELSGVESGGATDQKLLRFGAIDKPLVGCTNCTARIAASSANKGIVQARRDLSGVHSAARRHENCGARSTRKERGLQARSALSRRHRGAHLGCCGCARQQSDENRDTAHEAIVSQTKNCLMRRSQSSFAAHQHCRGSIRFEPQARPSSSQLRAENRLPRSLPIPLSPANFRPFYRHKLNCA
jgi:hypothetical protein